MGAAAAASPSSSSAAAAAAGAASEEEEEAWSALRAACLRALLEHLRFCARLSYVSYHLHTITFAVLECVESSGQGVPQVCSGGGVIGGWVSGWVGGGGQFVSSASTWEKLYLAGAWAEIM